MWQGHLPVTSLTSGKVYALKDNHAEFPNDSLEFWDYFDNFFFNSTHFRPYTVISAARDSISKVVRWSLVPEHCSTNTWALC